MGTACANRKEVPLGLIAKGGRSLDPIMQTAMSITIGLARKDLVAYFTYIFGYSRLERVQNRRLETESQRPTEFIIVIGQRRNPVRDAVKNERS